MSITKSEPPCQLQNKADVLSIYVFIVVPLLILHLPALLNFLTLTQLWNAVLIKLKGMLPVSVNSENLGNETCHYFRSSYGEYPATERSSDIWHKKQYFIFPVYLSWLIPQTSKFIHFISALTVLGSPWFTLSICNVPSIYFTVLLKWELIQKWYHQWLDLTGALTWPH